MIKIKTGFKDYSADALADLADKAGPQVANNPKLAGVTPTPADIATQLKDMRQKMTVTGTGAKTSLHTSMATLAKSLSTMAINIMETPGVTDTDLAETEFPLVKERERTTTVPGAPADLRLKHGSLPGQVLGSCQVMGENIRTFESQWTLDPNAGPWT